MAYSAMQMHRHDVFVSDVLSYLPGAKIYTEVRGWEDPRPTFVIQFRNGARFESDLSHEVINKAKAYFDATVRLTGEAP